MYCDGCGKPFNPGTRYCTACGKQLITGPVGPSTQAATAPAQMGVPGRAAADGRVGRNITIVAGLWLAAGVFRCLEFGGLMVFRRVWLQSGWNWPEHWPFGGASALNPFLMGGILSGGLFLVVFGAAYLLLGWGLIERQPWARMLGIVLAFLVLLRIPFGTALGIYTLWVLLPQSSEKEYDAMAGTGGRVSVAR